MYSERVEPPIYSHLKAPMWVRPAESDWLPKLYENVADIILFDSKGYEKSDSFNHEFLKDVKTSKQIMVAGDITTNDLTKLEKKYPNLTLVIAVSIKESEIMAKLKSDKIDHLKTLIESQSNYNCQFQYWCFLVHLQQLVF